MGNPWMGWWLREANRAAASGRRALAAEARRRQDEAAKAFTMQAAEMWLTLWFPWMHKRGGGRR